MVGFCRKMTKGGGFCRNPVSSTTKRCAAGHRVQRYYRRNLAARGPDYYAPALTWPCPGTIEMDQLSEWCAEQDALRAAERARTAAMKPRSRHGDGSAAASAANCG